MSAAFQEATQLSCQRACIARHAEGLDQANYDAGVPNAGRGVCEQVDVDQCVAECMADPATSCVWYREFLDCFADNHRLCPEGVATANACSFYQQSINPNTCLRYCLE